MAREATASEPDVAELSYLGALACARMGAIGEAKRWLGQIDRGQLRDDSLAADVWSLAGRIAKERYSAVGDKTSDEARESARIAIDCYRRAFDISRSAYPAINAATMSMLAGDSTFALTLAREALDALGTDKDHWHHATAGEAHLTLGDIADARNQYKEAHKLAGNRYGDIASMRRQLLLIDSPEARDLLSAVPAPSVIAFSGHMIDHPDRPSPRFPPNLEARVATALREKLAALGPAIGYAQAACGADILFLEAMQNAGMQTMVVLPFAKEDFVEASVAFAGHEWVTRFESVLKKATRIILATEEAFLGDDVLFEHAANLIQGMASLHARDLLTKPLMLTVREPESAKLAGGTAANTQVWLKRGGVVEEIGIAGLRDSGAGKIPARSSRPTPQSANPAQRSLKTLLFADIAKFSQLAEQHTPRFVGMFLEICRKTLDVLDFEPADANTRGDALFMVFEKPGHAAEYAVRLQQAVSKIDWPAFGLAGTGVRIGLHTGPVYRIYDPVMAKPTFYGTHVNRAARLEPIVQPGHIFVTEAFAASLVAEEEERFNCQYIGAMPLAKKFGDARLYRLAWDGEI